MIYGTAGRRYPGNYDVNSTGSSRLPGVIFSGIAPNPNNPNTPEGYYRHDGRLHGGRPAGPAVQHRGPAVE